MYLFTFVEVNISVEKADWIGENMEFLVSGHFYTEMVNYTKIIKYVGYILW